jgi:peptidoglycan/xylan/chitin deacetylase (PgdA/CDA1 family)
MVRVAPVLRISPGFRLTIAFDDCPDSACTRGVEVLDTHGIRGTFYIATGLLGQAGVSGPITAAPRLRELARNGHEIALHTHMHKDLTRVSIAEAIEDLSINIKFLQDILGQEPSPHFAYPFGETTLSLKRALIPHVTTARGVRGGVNRDFSDRMQLFACDLGSHRPDFMATAQRLIHHAADSGGWLVLFTHDVSESPSPYGISPQALSRLVKKARDLGAVSNTVHDVWAELSSN